MSEFKKQWYCVHLPAFEGICKQCYLENIDPLLKELASAEKDRWELNNLIQDDIGYILVALGLGDHARPVSPHQVIIGEIVPKCQAIEKDRRELRERIMKARRVMIDECGLCKTCGEVILKALSTEVSDEKV